MFSSGMDLAAQVAIPTIDWGEVATVLIGTPIKIVLIVLVCIASWIVLTSIINRVTKRLVEKAEADRLTLARRTQHTSDLSAVLMSQRRRARAEAIASLLRSITSAFIACIGVLLVLAQLEINITPLLASAGVIGVALGFGAQSLVKDYLSGIFLILEDQYGVGDVVDLGPVVGTVEEVTLRVTRVRDMSGVVWYVRNGEVLRVANRSQGWTLAIVDLPVAYDENLDRVKDLVEAVAEDMDQDPKYDSMLLDKPAFAGVESVSGEAVTIRVTAKAAPEQQVAVTRIIRERLKITFDRAGIRMPVVGAGQVAAPAAQPSGATPTSSLPGPGQPPPKTYGTGPLKP
ncbi:MAG: mechanosensitive ion channel domain-containing protein [Candidatus Nanopelagicales bacterium]